MSAMRRLLRSSWGGSVAAVLLLALLAPVVSGFHALAAGHVATAHDFVAVPPGGELAQAAAECTHGGARHVEAGGTVERPACAACLQRTAPALAAGIAAADGIQLAAARLPAGTRRAPAAIALPSPSSRGPPRA